MLWIRRILIKHFNSSQMKFHRLSLVFLMTAACISWLPSQTQGALSEWDWLRLSQGSAQQLGGKAQARWKYDQDRRYHAHTPDGHLTWSRSVERYQQLKQNSHQTSRNENWIPVGPASAPTPGNPQYISGTGRINTITFHPSNAQIMWVGGGQGGIWKTTNGGQSWMPIGDDLPVMRVSDIALNPNDPDEMYVSLGDYAYIGFGLTQNDRKRNFHFGLGVYKSTNGGRDWEPTGLVRSLESLDLSLTRRVFVHPDNDDIILAAGTQGIWRSEDRGQTFSQINDRMYWDIEPDPGDANILYASTAFISTIDSDRSALWKSNDFGSTWRKLETGIPEVDTVQRIEIGISPVDPATIFLVAANLQGGLYGIYRSTDGGDQWEMRSDTPNILHWFDGTRTGGQGNYDLAILPDPYDINKLYVSGVNHWVSNDAGSTWHGASHWVASHGPSVHADHHFLAYNPLDSFYYLCHDGGVARTEELKAGSWPEALADESYQWPTTWEHLSNGMANMSFYRIGLSTGPEIDIFGGSQDLGTFLRRGDQWTYNLLGDGMECIIHPLDPNIIYGSTQFGNIRKSQDGGQTWMGVGTSQPNWQSEFASWTTPYKIDPADPEVLYVPASNVWISKDGGMQFSQRSDFENQFPITGFAVAESDPSVMYVGKRVWYGLDQPGQAFRTIDGGDTWTDITRGIPDDLIINYVEVDDDNPLHVWMVFGSYGDGQKVFESLDGGDSWTNISLNLPNLPANCIVHHDGVGGDLDPIYVGMDRGIYYKTKAMNSWQLYSTELPNVIVSELEIHQGTQQIFAATFGRGVWRAPLVDQIATHVQQEQLDQAQILVQPNPNQGVFQLAIDDLPAGQYHYQIVDVMGKNLHTGKVASYGQAFSQTLDFSLLSGQYYLQLFKSSSRRTIRFLVFDD